MDRKSVIKTRLVNGAGNPSVLIVEFQTNALTKEVFKELNTILDEVEKCQTRSHDSRIDGVVFTSTKDKIFLAGADLFFLKDYVPAETSLSKQILNAIIEEGQQTFNRIENLKVPTVAAIHGACVGGGLELALACDYRICSNDKSTKLGLPEVTLGIIPAWGGTTRVTRMISLPNALKVLLTGAQFAAKPAKKMGLVDRIVHREKLAETALNIVHNTPNIEVTQPLTHRIIPAGIVLSKARKETIKKTNNNYPAPLKIIDVVSKSLGTRPNISLRLEKEAFIELCQTDEMVNLLRIFFLQEKSRKLAVSTESVKSVKDTAVVGAGTMGAGIAQWVSSRGVNVILRDVKDKFVSSGLKRVGDLYVDGVRGHKIDRPGARDGLARVTGTTSSGPLPNTDIVIEAIVENLEVKKNVLSAIESQVSNDAIIATNTSALSIDKMAECLDRPSNFVGIHFFNPVHKMKLVEVVKGKNTSDETVHRAVKFVQQIGKLPVVVKDSPGFVVNRILVPYLAKAAELLQEPGICMEQIDSTIVNFGMPMGPFRLMDEIGLDVCYHVAEDLKVRLGKDYDLSELSYRIGDHQLGKKSGKGFYKYRKGKCIRNSKKHENTSKLDANCSMLIEAMTDEAQKVLDERVCTDSDMIDFAMIMGTGWAPFRGGPLQYSQMSTRFV